MPDENPSEKAEMADLMKWFDTRRSPGEMIERLFDGDTVASGIRVEEALDGNTLVIRAEVPGIDPEKDISVSVVDNALEIKAERREKTEQKDKNSYRSEFRYGSFMRRVALPEGVQQDDITATYRDGVLEVRTPVPEESKGTTARKIDVTRG